MIQQKNIRNLIKKVGDGKTLTSHEEATLARYYEGQNGGGAVVYAKNKTELADQLGIDRRTINRWVKVEGSPSARSNGSWSVLEWRDWAERTGRKLALDDDDTDTERERLELRRLRTICEKIEFDFQISKGYYTANEDVEIMVRRMVGASRKILAQVPSSLAPQLAGLPIAEIEQRLKNAIEDALKHLHTGEWSTEDDE